MTRSKLDYASLLFAFALLIAIFALPKQSKCDKIESTSTSKEAHNQQSEGADADDDEASGPDPEYIKKELQHIFTLDIDKDNDGLASFEELRAYLIELNEKTIEHNVEKQWHIYSPQIHEVFSWEGYEPERKEVLTWEHYFKQTYPELEGIDVGIPLHPEQDTSKIVIKSHDSATETSSTKKPKAETSTGDENEDPHIKMLRVMVHRADARWKLADDNGDTLLTRSEFKYLWHPEEGNQELQDLFIKEATEDMDTNKNSKIELSEFMKHLDELATDAERNDEFWISSQKDNFAKFLDKNKDGVLDKDEIKQWLIPEKSKKFELEAKRVLDIGDKNEDLKLSKSELLDNFVQYTSLLPPEHWAVDEDADYWKESIEETPKSHDEL